MSKPTITSWADRISMIEQFKPSDEQACKTFGITQEELDTARYMNKAGLFATYNKTDPSSFSNPFVENSEYHFIMAKSKDPESAVKKIKEPKKRGRKGNKVEKAFSMIPTAGVPAEQFAKEHGISMAVLRQHKRFLATLPPQVIQEIGTINVRKDKSTNSLMIWRQPNTESK